jgi:hypothetical protein
LSNFRLGLDVSIELLDDQLWNSESHAYAAVIWVLDLAQLTKILEYLGQFLLVNTDAGVLHFSDQILIRIQSPESYLSPEGKLDRIAQDVKQDLLVAFLVRLYINWHVLVDLDNKPEVLESYLEI